MAMHFNKSLRRRFILTLIGVVTVISVIFSGMVIGYNYRKKEAELQKQLRRTLQLTETVLPEAVWQGDLQSVNNILQTILTDDAVIYARILVGNQSVASKIKPKYEGKKFSEYQNSNDFIISGAEIFRRGIWVAKLQVVMSRSETQREVFSTAFSVIGLFVLLVVAILFTSSLILRQYIIRPLSKLKRSANLIAAGNLDTPIYIDSSDEIGSLASVFRLMASHLKENFENLERKVIERTVDLSQAKISAEKVSQSLFVTSAELQALLDNSPVGILFVDTLQVIKRVNSEMGNITGYRSDELVGKTANLLFATQDTAKYFLEKCFSQLSKNGLYEGRVSLMKKDGTEIICKLRGRSVPASNELEGVIWSVEDITGSIRMEKELLIAKKQESIGVLAGGIAHDFNNILFVVMGNLSLAEKTTGEADAAREYITTAQAAASRAKELTAKLMTFANGGDPVKAKASLPALVREAAEFVLAGSNVQCAFCTPDDLWSVSMDKDQISQVIQDLVRNANQSMPEGGTILISFTNKKLGDDEVVGLSSGRYVCVSLADKGRGIEGQHLERIFDPYFSTKEKDSAKGSGLGLAIVHAIVTKHDGRITVDSIQGRGTTFTLYLPVRSNEEKEMSDRAAIIASGKGAVLVLEGDNDVHNIVCDMLLHIGYRAQLVSDGQEAIQLYRKSFQAGSRYCAVILDMDTLGEVGGRKLLADLLEIDPKVAVIAAKAAADMPILENYQKEGFSSLVFKPYQLLDLNRVMSSVSPKKSLIDPIKG